MSSEATDTPPPICPSCGHDMSDHPYSQDRPGPAARKLRKIALALLPVMGLVYLYLLFLSEMDMGFGTGAGYFAVALIGGPSFLLYAVSRRLPRVRLVICLHCSWNREYPPSGRTARPA
ncbi:MAG: hypothetical protein ACE5EG_08470 [Thermoanaerobaculia bacterium]